jgi:diacylglycerol kinase family enzyme
MASVSQPETTALPRRWAYVPPPDSRRVIVSTNPRAGSRWRRIHLKELETALVAAGFHVQSTSDLAQLSALTAAGSKGASDDIRAVVAIGGDGTASCVRRHVPLAIPLVAVPMGTENLLARFLKQKSTAAAVCETLQRGVVIGLDLGTANGQPFLLMISAGFDAEVVRLLHENRRGNITRGTYLKPTLQAIRSYQYPELRLYCDGNGSLPAPPHACRWVFGFNLPLYALGWKLAPRADGADGVLDFCTFERGSLPSACRYLWHVLRGTHANLPDASLFQQQRLRVECPSGVDVPYQLDGDYGGKLPVEIDIRPGDLRLMVSRSTAARLGFAIPGQPQVERSFRS